MNALIEDTRGNLWFSTGTTLFRYSKNQLTSFSDKDGLSGQTIREIFEDSKGKIWISENAGLSCFDNDRGKFTHYSTKDSKPGDYASRFILEDSLGKLWFTNSKGLIHFDGKRFKTYTAQRLGLTGRTWISGIKDDQGVLWFGSTDGVVSFYPPPTKLNTTPPPIHITSLKVMEKNIPLTGTGEYEYDRNIFRFNFVGLSFSDPSAVKYKYRLENIDKDWKVTKDRSLFYPFLPPGSYNLKVKAINNDGFESVKAAEYRFNISPPFWQTWWFWGLVIVFVCLLLVMAVQWRIKRGREKAELKFKNRQLVTSQRMELMGTLAAGTVHDLKNLMAVIIDYSRELSEDQLESDEKHQYSEIIKNTATTAVQMSKQILTFARPRHELNEPVELGTVVSEILETLKVMQPRNIQMQWQPPSEPILFPIHPGHLQQLVMNLCINAFQAMSNGGQLNISLSSTPEKDILLEISDTGATGIDQENIEKIFDPLFTTKAHGEGTGLGLFVVKQIVDQYNGKIDVNSEPGKGTTFVVRFPSTA
ncbi:MAG: GHKL domain-containing protein [bacterium]|nr:GHKL domain-containing protein [bacterium]